MSQELSIGRAARDAAAPIPIGRARPVLRSLDAAGDQSAPPEPPLRVLLTSDIVDVAWSPVANDPDLMISTLRAERAASRAGHDHPHAASGCGFCRRAAATYR